MNPTNPKSESVSIVCFDINDGNEMSVAKRVDMLFADIDTVTVRELNQTFSKSEKSLMVNTIEEYFAQHNTVRDKKTFTYSNYKDSSSFLQELKASFLTQATPVRVRFDSMEELNSFTSALVRKKVRNYPLEYRYACEKGENGYVLKHSCEEIKNFHSVNFPLIFYFESFEEIENFIEDYAGEYIPKGHSKKKVLIISASSVVFAVLCGWGIWSWVDYRAELKRELRREIYEQRGEERRMDNAKRQIAGKWTHVLQSGGDIGRGNFSNEVLVETLILNSNGRGRLETRYKEYAGNSLISSRSGGSFTFSWEFDGSTVYIDGSPEFTYSNGVLIDMGGNTFTK